MVPILDHIDQNNFAYIPSSIFNYGVFTWDLNIKIKQNSQTPNSSYKTPILWNTCLAADKEYFLQIGGFPEFNLQSMSRFEYFICIIL